MKIVIIGGGSYCWTPVLFRDLIFTPGLEGSEVLLANRRWLPQFFRKK